MEADAAMSENEHILADYKSANARRAVEMEEVRRI